MSKINKIVDWDKWVDDKKYTKGMCYAVCEFLDALTNHNQDVIGDICDVIGYDFEYMCQLLSRLSSDVDKVIATEQSERDDTDEMAQIMELKHISGHPDDWTMRDKHWNHDIKADDTAADLALVIDDIYANTSNDVQAVDAILALCKKILNKGV